jgi:energy-coupling factor transporter ATP-binding protein EcfA2
MEFAGMTLNGLIAESLSGINYVPLPDESVAVVGPNGVGKSSFIQALQRCINGNQGASSDAYLMHLDFTLPLNIEQWFLENADPGVIATIRKMLIARTNSHILEIGDIKTEDFTDLLSDLWKDSIREIKREWVFEQSYQNRELPNDAELQQLWMKHDLWRSYISVPTSQVPNGDLELARKYVQEANQNEELRFNSYDPALASFTFDISPAGNERTPKWQIDAIFKIAADELDSNQPLKEIVQMLTWPKTIGDAREYNGQFGHGTFGPDGSNFMQSYVRFINDEVWFGMNLGVTEGPLGFNLVNPDELTWNEIREGVVSLIGNDVTFTPETGSNHIFTALGLEKSRKRPRTKKELGRVMPIEPSLNFTPEFEARLKLYSDTASTYFENFIPGAPRIQIYSIRKELWITKGLIAIQVQDGYLTYDLENLSEAQQRWAKIALLMTAHEYKNLAIFIDEPEKGIQRKLESGLLEQFEDFDTGAPNLPRFFATHSAEIISHCSTVVQISRDKDGLRRIRRIIGSILPVLQQLDISQEEYFQSKKLIVLTEGIMDKAMLDGFAFDRFQKEGIEVIYGFGLESWNSYFDSQYLNKSSGVKIVFWADSLDSAKLNALVEDVKIKGIEDKAVNFFIRENIETVVLERWSKDQFDIVAAILSESLRTNYSKVRLESTGDYDCIMWVTPQILGRPKTETWSGIIQELNAQPRVKNMDSRGKRFKSLVKGKLRRAGVQDGLNALRLKSICQDLEVTGQIPPKVDQLINRIIAFARE